MVLFGCSGRAGSGKDEFYRIARRKFTFVQQVSFAYELKQEVAAELDKQEVMFEYRHLGGTQYDKEALLRIWHGNTRLEPWNSYLTKHGEYSDGYWYFKPRTFMQWWGSEFRRMQDENYWVSKCLGSCTTKGTVYICTDVRFPNEAQGIRDRGGILVRIKRDRGPGISNAEHISETALDTWSDWDYTILNSGTLDAYVRNVQDLVSGEIDDAVKE